MTKTEMQNQLSDLRNTIRELGDRAALDYISHAIYCFNRGQTKATETWLRMAIERMGQ